jgi:hypothetical protein
MDIPIDAQVECTDGRCGRSAYVILNPVTDEITHFVVDRETFPPSDRLVPIEAIVESTPQRILLNCTKAQVADMQPFIETEFLTSEKADYELDPIRRWPYSVPESDIVTLEHERIPPGELAVHRGAQVEAKDGPVGQVDEFLVDPATGHITHLVMREGHLWGTKDVAIPVSQIGRLEEDTVHVKLDKAGIEALPVIPIRRR